MKAMYSCSEVSRRVGCDNWLAQVGDAEVVGRAWARGLPEKFPLGLADRHVFDAGLPAAHQPPLVELPELVAVAAEPVAGGIMPLVLEPDGDPAVTEPPRCKTVEDFSLTAATISVDA